MPHIVIEDIVLLTGWHEHDDDFTVQRRVIEADIFGMVLLWRKSNYPYLDLSFKVNNAPVSGDAEAYETMANALGITGEWRNLLPDCIVATILTPAHPISVTVRIDTNDPQFRKEIEDLEEDESLTIDVHGFLLSVEQGEQKNEPFCITIVLSATSAKPFEGAVGLDLGNHNSSIAAFHSGLPDEPVLVKEGNATCNAQIFATGAPTLSTVWMRSVLPGMPLENLDTIVWDIGEEASNHALASMTGVELAAKKLIASPYFRKTKSTQVLDRHRGTGASIHEVEIPMFLPGELLACRMLHQFREATREYPKQLAVSYPTMFSEREVLQLREVAHRAWLRMQGKTQEVADLASVDHPFVGTAKLTSEDEGVVLMLDEASAAAFYFLFTELQKMEGKLNHFDYYHKHGMNLLLFDCGGGTTDIALVRASVKPSDPTKIVVTVRGRVGRRDFGGQYITEAVFKLLKAKVASLLDPNVKAPPAGAGATSEALTQYFATNGSKIDRVVPTQFHRGHGGRLTAEARAKLQRSMALWGVADSAKILLAEHGKAQVPSDSWDQVNIPNVDGDVRRKKLSSVTVTREEVDALIRVRLMDTIGVCNDLIFEKLIEKDRTGIKEDHSEPEEVHKVVVAGAASRYPLVSELLKEHLRVPFLNAADKEFSESRMTFDDQTLKSSVAQGLAKVLMTKELPDGMNVDFNSDLSQRLPFQVTFHNRETGAHQELFRENSHVASLTDSRRLRPYLKELQQLQPDEGAAEQPGHYVMLYRRFPGEKKSSPYLRFYFQQGVEGDMSVRYEIRPIAYGGSTFVMTNDATGEAGQCTDLTPPDSYLHPVQRGDL